MNKKKYKEHIIPRWTIITIILIFIVGLTIGYMIPRDVRIQVIKESGDYARHFEIIKEYMYPYNETDNVSMNISNNIITIRHTVPNEYGMLNVEIGIKDDGFFDYITQWKDMK